MQSDTLLLRQVHPGWVKEDGTTASLAFWPFPKDLHLLSVDDGDRVSAAEAWRRFTSMPRCASANVWAVTAGEVQARGLPVREDALEGNAFHLVVDFSAHSEKRQKGKC